MTKGRLKTLAPRLKTLAPRLKTARPKSTERVRGWRGQKERAAFVRENPLCKHCLERDVVRYGVIVDHIIPLALGGEDTPENKQHLCADCDAIKTKRDLADIAAGGGSNV